MSSFHHTAEIIDDELGPITLVVGTRYKRYSLSIKDGAVRATMPLSGKMDELMSFINANREQLRLALEKTGSISVLDKNTKLQTASFRLKIVPAERKDIKVWLHQEVLTIEYPQSIPVEQEILQQKFHEVLKNVFRHEAKRLLPQRLDRLARQYGFTYTEVKINSGKTRWGSCTSRKSINLSLYLMQLPWHLIDYVILHELCHTVEMNHSERFWAQMDRVTNNKSKALRQELRAFPTVVK